MTRVLRKFAAGETVSVEIYRSGSTKTLSVVLDEKPHEEPQTQAEQAPQQTPQQQMPGGDDFQQWYEYFRDYFG